MKNTNRILNATTSRNAKLVKYKDARKITPKKKKKKRRGRQFKYLQVAQPC